MKRRGEWRKCWGTVATAGFLFVVGCGNVPSGGTSSEALKLNGAEYGFLEKGTLAPVITGTGKIIFREPRKSQDNNFALMFSLEEAGSVTLTANADNQLQSGLNLTFSRKPDNKLKVVLAVGSETYDISDNYAGVSTTSPIFVEVDVHGHGHAVIWLNGSKEQYAFTTRVTGSLWGLTLVKATTFQAKADKAKEGHGRSAVD